MLRLYRLPQLSSYGLLLVRIGPFDSALLHTTQTINRLEPSEVNGAERRCWNQCARERTGVSGASPAAVSLNNDQSSACYHPSTRSAQHSLWHDQETVEAIYL